MLHIELKQGSRNIYLNLSSIVLIQINGIQSIITLNIVENNKPKIINIDENYVQLWRKLRNFVELKLGKEKILINPSSVVLVEEGEKDSAIITLNLLVDGNLKIINVEDSYTRTRNLIDSVIENDLQK